MYLAFGNESKILALPFKNVIEIFEYEKVIVFPVMKKIDSYISGLVLFHGELLPLLNPAVLFNLPFPDKKWAICAGENNEPFFLIPVNVEYCFPVEEREISKEINSEDEIIMKRVLWRERIIGIINFEKTYKIIEESLKKEEV